MKPWSRQGRWQVAAWNYRPEARGRLAPPGEARVVVVDSTIRSIITSEAGSAPSIDDLVDIAAALAEAGIRETVFNVIHDGERSAFAIEAARKLKRAHVPIRTSTELHVGPTDWKATLDFGISLEFDCLQWGYGVGGHIAGYTKSAAALELLEEGIEYLRERGQLSALAYNVMHDDDPEFIIAYFQRAARLPLQSLRLYDTNSAMSPDGIRWLVAAIKDAVGEQSPPVIVHTHNSFGLASALTIAAVLGGADGIDVVINGLGVKGGHTATAETLLALEALYGVQTDVKLDRMTSLSRLVAEKTGLAVPRVMCGVGEDFFLAEQAGRVMHAYEERDSRREYDVPWAPSVLGQKRRVVWGRNTLKTYTLTYLLRKLGISPTSERVDAARQLLTDALASRTTYPIWLEEEEVASIVSRVANPVSAGVIAHDPAEEPFA